MSLAEVLSFCSIFLGLGGTVFFALELLTTAPSDFVKIATLMWGKGVITAHSSIRQRYDYVSGILLVIMSIVLQVSSILCHDSTLKILVFETFFSKICVSFLLPMMLVLLIYSVSNRRKMRAIDEFNEAIKMDI